MWWDSLVLFEKVFWYIAIPFSIIFVIQLIFTFIGFDSVHSDFSADLHGDSNFEHNIDGAPAFSFFTIRNFVAFFTMFGWTGIVAINGGFSKGQTITFAFIMGLVIMFIISALFYFFHKLTDSGNLKMNNALGKTAQVYIPIKANSKNIGKVHIAVQSSVREMKAITKGDEDLATGRMVIVVEIIGTDTLAVEALKNED